jgi:hypothetical protein
MEPSPHSEYEQILRRAELFNCIVDLVRRCDAPDAVPAAAAPVPPAILPRITVVDRRVLCNGRILDLARRPTTLSLFRLFCAAPRQEVSREDVLRELYGDEVADRASPRYLESLHGNIVKLVSRARILASAFLSQGPERGIEWFVYSPERRSWRLYQLQSDYVARRQLTREELS